MTSISQMSHTEGNANISTLSPTTSTGCSADLFRRIEIVVKQNSKMLNIFIKEGTILKEIVNTDLRIQKTFNLAIKVYLEDKAKSIHKRLD